MKYFCLGKPQVEKTINKDLAEFKCKNQQIYQLVSRKKLILY